MLASRAFAHPLLHASVDSNLYKGSDTERAFLVEVNVELHLVRAV
jgi:hypothetical protein